MIKVMIYGCCKNEPYLLNLKQQIDHFSFHFILLITYRGQMAKLHIYIYKYNLPIKTLKYTDTSKLNAHQKLQNKYIHAYR